MNSSVKILGNRIDCFADYQLLYSFVLKKVINKSSSGYVTVNNAHTMIEGFLDKSYRQVINRSLVSIPDGKPLEIVGRLKGNKEISRLFGPSILEKFIDMGRADGIKHFFFGSSENTLIKLRSTIETKYPGAKIVGMLAPPFQPVNEWDNEEFVQVINEANPDFIWIGLGAPKQERWMFDNYKKIGSGLIFGIGAGFSYLAGDTKHAPQWMKNASLEWLYRLSQEPRRLWKRYLKTIPLFIILAGIELIGIQFKSKT